MSFVQYGHCAPGVPVRPILTYLPFMGHKIFAAALGQKLATGHNALDQAIKTVSVGSKRPAHLLDEGVI
jgi:hypothetical protein